MATGCKLGSQESRISRRSEYKILNPDPVSVDRIADGTSIQIRFTTKTPALCELFYFSQDPEGTPPESKPTRISCSKSEESRTEFNETVTGLDAETLYNFGIYVWSDGSPREKGEALIVREKSNNSGAIRLKDGTFSQILVARFNSTLRTVAFQRIGLEPPLKADAIMAKSLMATGCTPLLDQPNWTGRANQLPVGLTAFASRGFATAEGASSEKRIIAVFNTLQYGNPEWEWTYQTPERSNVLVKARPPGRLTAVEVFQSQRAAIPEVKLSDAETTIRLETNAPLNVSWQWDNLPAHARVHLSLGRPGDTGAVRCTFDPKSGRGAIPVENLAGLSPGKQTLMVELESISFQAFTGWLARSIDWRSIRVEKS
jgi:hypothetical protein